MEPLLAILLLGFVLGMRHATDADHVVAVTTIVSQQRSVRAAGFIGVVWGLGHTLTIFVVGGAIILFGIVIPPRLGLTMELSVAIMLVVLGAVNLTGAVGRIEEAAQAHGSADARHPVARWRGVGRMQLARSLVVGVVHGLAGSAAVALLVLTTIRDAKWALLYLVLFGGGTMLGMMLLTSMISLPFAFAAESFARINRRMAQVTSLVSIALGLFLTYKIGIAGGLFSSSPHWTPE
ncbi:MAG: high-affinity nickel-transport family protein [Polyangiaceae bacterium]